MINLYKKDSIPTVGSLNKIAELYTKYSTEEGGLSEIFTTRNEGAKIKKILEEGETIIITLSIKNKVIGILEYKKINVDGGLYIMLVWLIIDKLHRGNGYSSILHDRFEKVTLNIIRENRNVCKILSVNKTNFAKNIYSKWGYKEMDKETTNKKLFMYKDK